ncbi:hypothetical protein CAEBREN_12397 [Caenorhabditis brenneri]|uniref:Uncharacterized protein n=1 Tax=Caenorhabditis brenneri TaxID=135651 RepID=G0NVV3_CAEBE|nr:hypothetical protein CAEBREN_12397 [Caenorhabditis brenneri]
MNAVPLPLNVERAHQERIQYLNFLKLNYRILERYEQIHDIFLCSLSRAITNAEIEHERQKLEEVNAVIASLRNVILTAEKKNENKLFSD